MRKAGTTSENGLEVTRGWQLKIESKKIVFTSDADVVETLVIQAINDFKAAADYIDQHLEIDVHQVTSVEKQPKKKAP